MRDRKLLNLVSFVILLQQSKKKSILTAPAGQQYTKMDRNCMTVIPNGRFITPLGININLVPNPYVTYGLIVSNNGNIAVTAYLGMNPLSISIIRSIQSNNPHVQ